MQPHFILKAAIFLLLVVPHCACTREAASPGAAGGRSARAPADDGWMSGLLDLPLAAAARMPADPHLKNRSKVQEELAAALLEAGAIEDALRVADAIGNWRKGCVYADAACACADLGREQEALALLDKAHTVAEAAPDDGIQDWQRGRVRGKIARAYLRLGREAAAKPYMQNLEPAEAKAVAAELASQAPVEHFDSQRALLDEELSSGNFERIKAAIDTAVLVHARWYDERADRDAVVELLEARGQRLPIDIRVGALLSMAGTAASKGDKAGALALLDKARALVDGAKWLPEHRIPLDARVAELQHMAGDTAGARTLLAGAVARYDAEGEQIVNIYRAGTLRPVAEALWRTGDGPGAIAAWRRALEAGMANPNSRPRLDDLSATCISLARAGCKPDASMQARIEEIAASLGEPW